MPDLNALFLPVGNYCRRDVATCSPDDRLVDAADRMRQLNISSLVVCRQGIPIGIMTDRDLRNKVVAPGLEPSALTVAEIMNSPLITILETEYLFEALHRISRHRIHRLVVTDLSGQLAGIITDSDILRIQVRSPQQLMREIEEAPTISSLQALHQRVQGLVEHLIDTGIRIRDLVRLIAHLNDRILIRLVELLKAEQFADLQDRCAFLVLGSEGRGEQTLTTDQDNALVYDDGMSSADLQRVEQFSEALIAGVIAIGVPACPGGIMAKNPQWRHSLSEWRSILDDWFGTPTPENIMRISMISDLRALSGNRSLEQSMKEHIQGRLMNNETFLGHMTANLLRFPVPLGWFGRITSGSGEHKGQLDLKKAGIFAITEGVRILSLSTGISETGTAERIRGLVGKELLSQQEANDLISSFDALVYFRLRTQVDALKAGRKPDNRITLGTLNRMERGRLRTALEGVRSFQGMLQRKFRLGQMI